MPLTIVVIAVLLFLFVVIIATEDEANRARKRSLQEHNHKMGAVVEAAKMPVISTAFVNDQGVELPEFVQVHRKDMEKLQEALADLEGEND